MPFKLSRCICLSTPDHGAAVDFYRDVIGLSITQEKAGSVEFTAGPYRLFVDKSLAHGDIAAGMVFELIVDNLESAREKLLGAGCTVIRWEGKGKDCYMKDPFGAVFNLWEDPEAFR